MPVPALRVLVAFASAPEDPAQQWTDVSADVTGEVTLERGRPDEFSAVEPGRMSVTLDNSSGNYTYGNASGAHYPNVLPGKRIRVDVSADGGGSWSTRWDGYVDGWPMGWADGVAERPEVTITATDRLSRFGLTRLLRHALAEELGTAAAPTATTFVLAPVADPMPPDEDLTPGDSLYPAADLYPSAELVPTE